MGESSFAGRHLLIDWAGEMGDAVADGSSGQCSCCRVREKKTKREKLRSGSELSDHYFIVPAKPNGADH